MRKRNPGTGGYLLFCRRVDQAGTEQLWRGSGGMCRDLPFYKRSENGAIAQLQIEGEKGSTVLEENTASGNFLQTVNAQVTLQDGSAAPHLGMLPSAFFFYLTPEYEGRL